MDYLRIKFDHYGNIIFKIHKVGNHRWIVRNRDDCYLLGLIFVIDSNDRERVGEARDELQRMLSEDELRDAILLIFANKQVRSFF